jgi:hypothetical protein
MRIGTRTLHTVASALLGLTAAGATLTSPLAARASAASCTAGDGGAICMSTSDSGLYVHDVQVKFNHRDELIGHASLSDDSWGMSTPDQQLAGNATQVFTLHVDRSFRSGSSLCAEVWQRTPNGGHALRGRPCVTVPV